MKFVTHVRIAADPLETAKVVVKRIESFVTNDATPDANIAEIRDAASIAVITQAETIAVTSSAAAVGLIRKEPESFTATVAVTLSDINIFSVKTKKPR